VKRALICGISGQDGAYLAHLLLQKGYEVYGTSRNAQTTPFLNLKRFDVRDRVGIESMTLSEFRSVLQVLTKIQPDEVYNFAGHSSIEESLEQPLETFEILGLGVLNLLEAIRYIGKPIRFFNAGSSQCFGDTRGEAADENTPFRPRSPYAAAKAAAFWAVVNYRERYGLYACSGILFNHESPLRPQWFVTKKVVNAACRIASGSREKLNLGNLAIQRDWGWAPEYVEVMWSMLQQPRADDYVVATGESHRLEEFVASAFEEAGLQWRDHVVEDASLLRPIDLEISRANPAKAAAELGWRARNKMRDVVRQMVQAQRKEDAAP